MFSLFRKGFTAGRGVLTGLPTDVEKRDPIALFSEWFTAARKSGIALADAMCLATCTADGQPSARMVLLKEIEERGVVFYTNYESRKADELKANPRAAAVIHWTVLQRQVRIEGRAEPLERSRSERYFQTRGRGSQIGAWASRQSRPLESRAVLEEQEREIRRRFQDQTIPLPEFWGGFRIEIEAIEFWQGRVNRLHDRVRFEWNDGAWQARRLYP